MKIVVVGKTDSILNLNKIGIPIRGKEQVILEINTEEKKNEILLLKKAGYLDILEVDFPSIDQPSPVSHPPTVESPKEEPPKADEIKESPAPVVPSSLEKKDKSLAKKSKGGRPKGAKNKNKKSKPEEQRVAEAEAKTQEMGSRVIIGTGNGNVEAKMQNTFEGKVEESEATKESLKAMEDIVKEENENKKKEEAKVDENKLDPSEQMGREAVYVQEGSQKKSPMAKSIIPEQEKMRGADPFIDKAKDAAEEAFVDKDIPAKDPSQDAFVEKKEDGDDDSFLKI